MRPIKLKIKGLNSFIEEQTIDFEKLTSQGFFGIFGPTGSGKSTILDGITLALYGAIARKSSNYINTNCKTMSVSFQFQISGHEVKRYQVERDFKRDPSKEPGKEGIRTSGVKLLDITNETPEVLEDSVGGVNRRCQEIIGLNLDDFTRTVVLPQGKFSEFLKLEGRERREMLERLFSLQKYGDLLTMRLSKEIGSKKSDRDVILGQLIGYEELSAEFLVEKQGLLIAEDVKLKEVNDNQKNIEKQFRENEELWKLQEEQRTTIDKEQELMVKKPEIEEARGKLAKREGAARVLPIINDVETTKAELDMVTKELESLEMQRAQLRLEKQDAGSRFEDAKARKDKDFSLLELKKSKVTEAILEKQLLKSLEKETSELTKQKQELEIKIQQLETKLAGTEIEIEDENTKIKKDEQEVDRLKIDEVLKQKIQDGLIISEKYGMEALKIENEQKKLKQIQEDLSREELNWAKASEAAAKTQLELEEQTTAIDMNLKACPGDEKHLLELQASLTESRDNWKKFILHEKAGKEAELKIVSLKSEIEKHKSEKIILESSLDRLKTEIKEYEQNNFALKLRENLLPGGICPVCGSTEHQLENLKAIVIHETNNGGEGTESSAEIGEVIEGKVYIEVLSKDFVKKHTLNENMSVKLLDQIKSIEALITKSETQLENETNILMEAQAQTLLLGEDFKSTKPEELEKKFKAAVDSLGEYNLKKEQLEKKVAELKEEKANSQSILAKTAAIIDENKKQEMALKAELTGLKETLETTGERLSQLSGDTEITDFKKKNEEIRENESTREKLTNGIKVRRAKLEQLLKMQVEIQKILIEGNQERVKIETFIAEKTKAMMEKRKAIVEKAGTSENLEDVLMKVELLIQEIVETLKQAEEMNQKIEKLLLEVNERMISLSGKKEEIGKQMIKLTMNLAATLLKENFPDIETARSCFIPEDLAISMKQEVADFDETIMKLKGYLESLAMKIGNRVLSAEAWQTIQDIRTELENELKERSEKRINLAAEVKAIKERLDEQKELMEQKGKIDRRLALLGDLEKLFKGKKFVEYVAITQLKYISLEGSKRLKDITSGGYGLEVDENGKFIIRDYKNGGAERDASTLSGGETFLASLALALALSAQIQLKGAAPLELFFLDEGFGTLDDDLLDVVLSSLEKIHHEKLKVGIISHVGTIKDRVPVKLMITPAVSGLGGSKVAIE